MKTMKPLVAATLLVICACSSSRRGTPSTISAEVFDAMMLDYQTNGRPDVIRLGAGTYLTRGSSAWHLAPGDSIVGAGMKRTLLRRIDPTARRVINGWTHMRGSASARISDLTIDANATLWTNWSPCGITGLWWKDCQIERVRVIGLGSFINDYTHPSAESFGIILEDSTNCVIRDCVIDRNVGGYVTATCISGKNVMTTNCTVNFTTKPGWMTHYAAFAVAGMGPDGSKDLRIVGNRTTGARNMVYNDTGKRINGLTISNNVGTVTSYPIFLTGTTEYINVTTNNNRIKLVK